MKQLVILLSIFSLIAAFDAKGAPSADKKKDQAQKKEIREKKREALKVILEAKDKNGDGSLTKDEFLTGEADTTEAAKRFDQYNKNGDRYLTKTEIEDSIEF